MKIVCIVGSPHGEGGNTGRLSALVAQGARGLGAEVETICLKGRSVLPCQACDACHKVGLCPQKDDFESLRRKVAEADGVILASPNYIFSVSAQVKAFMDRCCGVVHCLGFEGKYGVSVVTSGGGGDDPIIEYMNNFLLITGIRPVGGVHATMAALPEGEFTEGLRRQALELGEKLVLACREKPTDPETDQAMKAFGERMRALITWRRDEWPYEYRYWQQRQGMAEGD